MALRANTKITREILQNYSRILSNKPEFSQSTACHSQLCLEPRDPYVEENSSSVRYKISDGSEPEYKVVLNKSFDMGPKNMEHLQPSMLPKYKDHGAIEQRIKDTSTKALSLFPQPFKMMASGALADDEKAAQMLALSKLTKMGVHATGTSCRGYSTSPLMKMQARFAHSDKRDCKKKKQPKKCARLAQCPKFALAGCECPKYCEKSYKTQCTKRLAPYPSYSESCVEEFDEDPSECVQCPWKYCPEFKPQQKKYHTTTIYRDLGSNLEEVLPPPPASADEVECDARKEPCPPPDSKCEKRRKLEERLKAQKEKCPEKCPDPCKKKKCSGENGWTRAYAVWTTKADDIFQPDVQLKKCDTECEKFPFDEREADYNFKRQRRTRAHCPKCPRRGKLRKIVDCPPECQKTAAGILQDLTYELKRDPPCPPKTPKYPNVDHSMDCARDRSDTGGRYDEQQCPPRHDCNRPKCPVPPVCKKNRPCKRRCPKRKPGCCK